MMSTPTTTSLLESHPGTTTRRARNVRILDAPDPKDGDGATGRDAGASASESVQPVATSVASSSVTAGTGGGRGGGLLLSPSSAVAGGKIPQPPRDGGPSRERANTVAPVAPAAAPRGSAAGSAASAVGGAAPKRRESHRSSIRQLSASTATEDRSLLDQRLFYAKSRESGIRHVSPFGGDSSSLGSNEFFGVDGGAASGRSSGEVEVAPPIDLTMPWASFLSLRFVTVHTPFSDVAVLDGCMDPVQTLAELAPSTVCISERVSEQFIASLKDFYRTGVRYSKRRSCATTLPPAPSSAALLSRSVNVTAQSTSAATHAASPASSAAQGSGSELRMKVAAIEQQIAEMRRSIRGGGGMSASMATATASGRDTATTMDNYLDELVGLNSGSFHVTPTNAGADHPDKKEQQPNPLLPMSSSVSFRNLDTSFVAQNDTTAKPSLRRLVDSRRSRAAHLDDARPFDLNPESLPDTHLVDRFTPSSLEALAAVAVRLGSTMHAKLRHVQLLNLSGCSIGDDGLFVVLQAMRFGPLHRVQCLDVMYNQLTSVSAFYMGIFLLLRPPSDFVNPLVNDALRATYTEARIPIDPNQKALEVIAAQRAQAKAGGGSSSANKQSPPFFFPHSWSSKTLVEYFFGGRAVEKASARGAGSGRGGFFSEAQQHPHKPGGGGGNNTAAGQRLWPFGGRGSVRTLKSAASAVMTVGVLRKRISHKAATAATATTTTSSGTTSLQQQQHRGSTAVSSQLTFLADPSIVNVSESGVFGDDYDNDYDDDDGLGSCDSDESSTSSSDESEQDSEAVGMGITAHFRELEMILTPTHQQQQQQQRAVHGRSGLFFSPALESPVPLSPSPRANGSSNSSSAAAADRRRSLMTTMAPAVAAKIRRLQEKDQLNSATDLVSLRLGWNDLQDVGIATLSEWIVCQTFLLELDVSYNDAQEDGFAFLRESLRSNTSLVSLNTEGNTMDDATAEALRGTLLYNRRLLNKVQHAASAAAGGSQTPGDPSAAALSSSQSR